MEFPEKAELIERYQKYTDQELLHILKHPEGYQDLALEVARELAHDRGLSPEEGKAAGASSRGGIFPRFTDAAKARNLIKSIQRLFYFVALIPFITGALSFADGYPSLALVYGGIAVLWAAVAFFAVQRKKHQMVLFQFLLLIFMLVTRYMTTGFPPAVQTVDWLIYGIILLSIVYLLVYFKILIRDYLR
ncbi:hypothetical protein [Mangrovibacterium marinum]|uniref:Uncharacterized protein n=1 Tax=Mangrovibacterium marinum TaxID=1639118 RepID=A0A2T5C553_9BACT|nr:hypothetical protein [Mangrovibacterium marinum]PTN10041.1 hypothetical protein C8N47_10221 [Mangrovibacterium marinum]